MRKSLKLALGGTLAMSVLSLWIADDAGAPRVVQAAIEASARHVEVGALHVPSGLRPEQAPGEPLPPRWEGMRLEAAKRNIFAVPEAPVPEAAPMLAESAPTVEPPQAPAVHYRFLGRMTGPEGESRVYLSREGRAVPVSVGDRLDEGFVVQAIGDEAVQLHYPPLGTQAVIPIPPPGHTP